MYKIFLETGIYFYRDPVLGAGKLEEGSSSGKFERWLTGLGG